MTYTLFQDEYGINVFNGNDIYKIANISELNPETNSTILTCGQSFVTRLHQYDISVIEKMIFFPGRKDLKRLYEKYSHKTIDVSNISYILKGIAYVYKRQQEYIDKYQIRKAVDFHAETAGIIAYINAGAQIAIKDEYIQEIADMSKELSSYQIMSRQEVISYMTTKRYDFYEVNTGKFRLDHAFLLSLNDPILTYQVEGESFKGKFAQKKTLQKYMPINHSIYGAITGRIQTAAPNIQGIDKNAIQPKGELYSFDFTGFEIIIYLSLYNLPLLQEFTSSGKNDIFAWIFYKLYPNKYNFDSDQLKANEPDKRNSFKTLVIRSLYGATKDDVVYWYGDKILPLYKNVLIMLNIVAAKKELVDYASRTGRYLINKAYNLSTQDRWVNTFAVLQPEAKKWREIMSGHVFSDEGRFIVKKEAFDELNTKERGIVEKCIEAYKNVLKLALNYHIQGTGAFIIKKAVHYMLKQNIASQILIIRHDEVLVDLVNQDDIYKIQIAMAKAAKDIIGHNIHVKCQKI